MKGNYKYKEQPLGVEAAKDLIVELFAGKNTPGKEISEKVLDTHIKREGKPSESTTTNPVSDALEQLKGEGLATRLSGGVWAIIERVIGEGADSVYVYYYPTYRDHAESQGMNVWACKVGRTKNNPRKRIRSQSSTALPEYPAVELIIKTDEPKTLEGTLHNVLKFKGKFKEDAPGKEWFITSPSEVQQIYEAVLKI